MYNKIKEKSAGNPNKDTPITVNALIGIIILKFPAIILKPYNIKKLNTIFLKNKTIFFIKDYHLLKNMDKNKFYSIFFLSSNALSRVIASIYSISAPTGIPLAILDIFISISPKILLIYKAVVSPSILGLKARIISLK